MKGGGGYSWEGNERGKELVLGGGWVEGEQCMLVAVIVVVAEEREQWVNKKGCSWTDACM